MVWCIFNLKQHIVFWERVTCIMYLIKVLLLLDHFQTCIVMIMLCLRWLWQNIPKKRKCYLPKNLCKYLSCIKSSGKNCDYCLIIHLLKHVF